MLFAKIKSMLTEPDGFTGGPWGFAKNQAWHTAGGAAATLIVGPVAAIAIYAIVWEYVQWRWYGAQAWDNAEDLGFFAAGALVVATSPWVLVVALLFWAAGILRRIEERHHADRDPD